MQYLLEQPVHGDIGTEKYKCTITWRNGTLVADEPEKTGGKSLGPDPHSLLLASLASCTLMTLRMYIDRKGWDVASIAVDANLYQAMEGGKLVTTMDRDIRFLSPVTEEQRKKLLEIAAHCPISKILQGEMKVRTFTYSDADLEKKINYSNEEGAVVWKPELCQHSARCVSGLPEVFNANAKPWINAHGAPSDKIMEQVKKCPTGAISFAKRETSNIQG